MARGSAVRYLLIAFNAMMLSASRAHADGVADFYHAKGLTVVVGNPPGGTYDLYARLVARHMGRMLPGKPNVIVQNMPGAGSLHAANYIYGQAPKDGSQIAVFASGLPMQPLFDAQGIRFDARRMVWIGSPAQEVSIVFAWHTTPFYSIEDLKRSEMIVPGTGGGANSVIYPRLLNGILGTRLKLVSGYRGSAETMLAISRGEVQGHAGGSWENLIETQPSWVREGKVRVLLQLAQHKHPDLPEVPLITELPMSATDRQVLDTVLLRQTLARPFAAPPETPAERVGALRQAFDGAMKDPEFLADAARTGVSLEPTGGAAMEAMIMALYAAPPEVIARVRSLIGLTSEPGAGNLRQ